MLFLSVMSPITYRLNFVPHLSIFTHHYGRSACLFLSAKMPQSIPVVFKTIGKPEIGQDNYAGFQPGKTYLTGDVEVD